MCLICLKSLEENEGLKMSRKNVVLRLAEVLYLRPKTLKIILKYLYRYWLQYNYKK